MANSLVLPSPALLSGLWTIIEQGNSCDIHLKTERFEQANGYKLSVSPNCMGEVLPERPEAWRPTPDGIALLNKEGVTVLFFSQEGDHYRSQIWARTGKILSKRKK
ncbi:protease inhibitor Inh/omp19 family protein [Serratia rubidaea]|nr:protease inhibitor Inh/omp19 family protein [Serratia rubidaea]